MPIVDASVSKILEGDIISFIEKVKKLLWCI